MPDHTDDWMNPPTSFSYSTTPYDDLPDIEYLIERKAKQICFGSPGYITEWKFWSSHETAEERDSELEKLREDHPVWILRARDRKPKLERLGVYGLEN